MSVVAAGSEKRSVVMRNRCLVMTLWLFAPVSAFAAEAEFVVRIKDHHFIPAELHVSPGVKIRIVLENQDETPEEFESYSLNREKHVPPKSRVAIFIGPLGPGRYLFGGENKYGSSAAALGVIVVK